MFFGDRIYHSFSDILKAVRDWLYNVPQNVERDGMIEADLQTPEGVETLLRRAMFYRPKQKRKKSKATPRRRKTLQTS